MTREEYNKLMEETMVELLSELVTEMREEDPKRKIKTVVFVRKGRDISDNIIAEFRPETPEEEAQRVLKEVDAKIKHNTGGE